MLHRFEWARRALGQAATEAPDAARLVPAVAGIVQSVVRSDAADWHEFDPASVVPTSRRTTGIAIDAAALSRIENGGEDYALFSDLARRPPHSAALGIVTGDRDRSRRYREVLAPAGIGDELRAVFVVDGCAWGGAALYRLAPATFSGREAQILGSLAGVVGRAFRSLAARRPPTRPGPDGPGLILLDHRNRPESFAGSAGDWVRDLGAEPGAGLPYVVRAVADRARFGRVRALPATARVRGASGRWAFLHGSPIAGGEEGRVAVILDGAGPGAVAPLLADAYGLTARERAVADLVLEGCATGEIADRLYISPHTVQQHLKAVFAKSGVRSRRELVGRVLQRDGAADEEAPVPA